MAEHPVNHEVAAILGRFFTGGEGPRHTDLTSVFMRTSFHDADPYSPENLVNKESRVRAVLVAAESAPLARARELLTTLLAEMRADGCLAMEHNGGLLGSAKQAFRRLGWELTDHGDLRLADLADVMAAEGRPGIEEQLDRLRRSTEDPALMIGTAKDMLEATAKYVLEEFGHEYGRAIDFDQLWHLARERLSILPQDIDTTQPGGEAARTIVQSAWNIARQVNELRKLEGTGHGRTLPSGVSSEMAILVVRQACIVAEFTLSALDRQFGR